MSKKQDMKGLGGEFPPRQTYRPEVKVSVSLVEPGSRLDVATKALNDQSTAQSRAEMAEVEKYQASLQPEISAARAGLESLGSWERANKADLVLLRSLNFDGARGVADEGLRVAVLGRVASLFNVITKTRETFSTADARVSRLSPGDLAGPRMHSDAPGIRSYEDLAPAAVEQIRFDVQRAARTVLSLDKILGEAQGAVTNLAANLERVTRVRERAAALGHSPKSTATAIDPDLLAQRAAGRPGPVQTKADSDFSGYETDNKKN